MAAPGIVDLAGRRRCGVDAERHQTEPAVVEAVLPAVLHGRLAGAQDSVGPLAHDVEAAGHQLGAVLGELLGRVQECEVMHRHHERCRCRARDQAGGMGEVDGADDRLDLRPVQACPGLVEQRPRQRQHRHGTLRSKDRIGWSRVLPGDQPEVDLGGEIRIMAQLACDPQRCDRRAPGRVVPALFDRVCHADRR